MTIKIKAKIIANGKKKWNKIEMKTSINNGTLRISDRHNRQNKLNGI